MLGEKQQTFFTVKDLSAREFIEAFAQYLKKNNFVERPAWVDLVKTGTRIHLTIQVRSTLPSTRTGSTLESPPLPAKSTCAPTPESDSSPTSTEASSEESANPRDTSTPPPRSSDGACSSSRSSNSSRRTRREILLSSTHAFFRLRAAECSTESLPSTSRSTGNNDVSNALSFSFIKVITSINSLPIHKTTLIKISIRLVN